MIGWECLLKEMSWGNRIFKKKLRGVANNKLLGEKQSSENGVFIYKKVLGFVFKLKISIQCSIFLIFFKLEGQKSGFRLMIR